MLTDPPLRATSIVVLGSLNADTVMRVDRAPDAGETVIAASTHRGLGGKGANQAVAAANAGAPTSLVGCVGDDRAGDDLVRMLGELGVNTSDMHRTALASTGAALVVVDIEGENRIVVDMGANAQLSETVAHDAIGRMRDGDLLVVQTEIAPSIVLAGLERARSSSTRFLLNLAPVIDVGEAVRGADPLVVNAVELGQLTGSQYASAADVLDRLGEVSALAVSVVVTLGPAGAVVIGGGTAEHVPAVLVDNVVDTTGAGDAFVGVLAARLAAGDELVTAARIATRYAARVVGLVGAADRYPEWDAAAESVWEPR